MIDTTDQATDDEIYEWIALVSDHIAVALGGLTMDQKLAIGKIIWDDLGTGHAKAVGTR